MKQICAGAKIKDQTIPCGKHLSGDPNDTEISHGVCLDCMALYMADMKGLSPESDPTTIDELRAAMGNVLREREVDR